jgi:poly(ADP-ribose) glycohydrolase ARH3
MFPYGSFGNGSAMRVAPIGLVFANDLKKAVEAAIASSRPTHSHPLAYQGAVLQTIAVAMAATSTDSSSQTFFGPMRTALTKFSDLLQDTSPFVQAMDAIENGLGKGTSCLEMSSILGTGVTAQEAVPMAIYCFLRHPESYERVIHEAVFVGGDTDTIACMAGAISGTFLGVNAIPARWLSHIKEERYSAGAIENLADDLFDDYISPMEAS